MNIRIFVIIVFIILTSIISCKALWEGHSLGMNFALLEGDKKEDRIIAYCFGGNLTECSAPTYVIPTYERHMKEGKYEEYVESVISDKNWIVAKTRSIGNKCAYYWILNKNFKLRGIDCEKVNCDSVIQLHVVGPLSFQEFQRKIEDQNIPLKLE